MQPVRGTGAAARRRCWWTGAHGARCATRAASSCATSTACTCRGARPWTSSRRRRPSRLSRSTSSCMTRRGPCAQCAVSRVARRACAGSAAVCVACSHRVRISSSSAQHALPLWCTSCGIKGGEVHALFAKLPSILHAADEQMRSAQVNNGTYKSGFATSQAAYDRAQRELYAALDELEARLGRHRFLVGDRRAPATGLCACLCR